MFNVNDDMFPFYRKSVEEYIAMMVDICQMASADGILYLINL